MFVEGVVHSACVVVVCMSKFCVGLGSGVVSPLIMSKSVKSSSESSMLKSKSMSGEEGGSKLEVRNTLWLGGLHWRCRSAAAGEGRVKGARGGSIRREGWVQTGRNRESRVEGGKNGGDRRLMQVL